MYLIITCVDPDPQSSLIRNQFGCGSWSTTLLITQVAQEHNGDKGDNSLYHFYPKKSQLIHTYPSQTEILGIKILTKFSWNIFVAVQGIPIFPVAVLWRWLNPASISLSTGVMYAKIWSHLYKAFLISD